MEPWNDRKIAYLVKRGNCKFSQKVHNVYLQGGDLAIIYNDKREESIMNLIPIGDKKYKDDK